MEMGKHGGQVPGHRLPKGTCRWSRGEAGLQGARENKMAMVKGRSCQRGGRGSKVRWEGSVVRAAVVQRRVRVTGRAGKAHHGQDWDKEGVAVRPGSGGAGLWP